MDGAAFAEGPAPARGLVKKIVQAPCYAFLRHGAGALTLEHGFSFQRGLVVLPLAQEELESSELATSPFDRRG